MHAQCSQFFPCYLLLVSLSVQVCFLSLLQQQFKLQDLLSVLCSLHSFSFSYVDHFVNTVCLSCKVLSAGGLRADVGARRADCGPESSSQCSLQYHKRCQVPQRERRISRMLGECCAITHGARTCCCHLHLFQLAVRLFRAHSV